MMLALLAVAVALGAAVAGVMVSETLRSKRRLRRRMQPIGELLGVESGEQAVAVSAAPEMTAASNTLLAWLQTRFPLLGGGKAGLIGLGVALLTITLLMALLVFLQIHPVLAALAALGCAAGACYGVVTTLEAAQMQGFNNRFLLAMEDFQRMVRFGIPTMQALSSVTDAAEAPLKPSLRNILLDAGLGVPLEQAMAREAYRVRVSGLAMLAAILSTQAATGGNLSEAVGNLATMLRERRDNLAKMQAVTAESRVTLMILALVPVAAIFIQWRLQPELVDVLFGEGRHLLGLGLALIAASFVVSWLMIRSAQR